MGPHHDGTPPRWGPTGAQRGPWIWAAWQVSHVETSHKGTGLGGMGNKGAVAVSMQVRASSLCFVGCHLAARPERVAERNAKVGNLTESFQRERMFHVVEQKQLYGIVHLPEKELTRVHVNQEAYLNLAALNDQRVVANVARISPVIDSQTGTFKVTLKVSNSDNILKAGMFAQVKLNYDTHENATLLPRRALLHIDDV